jgi:hypothetical protein
VKTFAQLGKRDQKIVRELIQRKVQTEMGQQSQALLQNFPALAPQALQNMLEQAAESAIEVFLVTSVFFEKDDPKPVELVMLREEYKRLKEGTAQDENAQTEFDESQWAYPIELPEV